MKKTNRIRNALKGFIDAVSRFPLTSLFLLMATIMESIYIDNYYETEKYLVTLIVGALLGAVAQIVYERFFNKSLHRLILTGIALLLTIGYYLIILPAPKLNTEIEIRTIIALFALLISFIWIPSIKRKISFNECFMAAFKAFFISLLFALVLFGGISLIIAAIETLLFDIHYNIHTYVTNIIFILFAPVFFLSIIPVYNIKVAEQEGKASHDASYSESNEETSEKKFEQSNDEFDIESNNESYTNSNEDSIREIEEKISKATSCPKYLEILISYIIIPLAAVFTLVLAAYIVINIASDFWSDNLLEPMFVSYSIIVIVVYILASNLENKFAIMFRKIFPKILIPIAAFQTIASIMKIQDVGITHNRYLVIIYGLYAIAVGVIFSLVQVRKNGVIAAILIIISAITIIPPLDAFTISRNNQMAIAKKVLLKNNMLENDSIIKKNSIPDEDKSRLMNAIEYLYYMDYVNQVPYLNSNFNYYQNFKETFGFSKDEKDSLKHEYLYLTLEDNAVLDISGHDFMARTYASIPMSNSQEIIGKVNKSGNYFSIKKHNSSEDCIISLHDETEETIISVSTSEVFWTFFEKMDSQKNIISVDEATFTTKNERATLTLIINDVNMHLLDQANYNADVVVLIKIN